MFSVKNGIRNLIFGQVGDFWDTKGMYKALIFDFLLFYPFWPKMGIFFRKNAKMGQKIRISKFGTQNS